MKYPPGKSGCVPVPTIKLDGFCKPMLCFTDPAIDAMADGKWLGYLDSLHPGEAAAKRQAFAELYLNQIT